MTEEHVCITAKNIEYCMMCPLKHNYLKALDNVRNYHLPGKEQS